MAASDGGAGLVVVWEEELSEWDRSMGGRGGHRGQESRVKDQDTRIESWMGAGSRPVCASNTKRRCRLTRKPSPKEIRKGGFAQVS